MKEKPSIIEIEQKKVKLYNKYRDYDKKHDDLFKKDTVGYWHKASKFVDYAMIQWLYYDKDPLKVKVQ